MMAKLPKPASGSKEVGPGRPPVHSRFPKGVSGNPKGRPKKERNFCKLIEEELDQTVLVTEGRRRVRLTKREIMAKKLVNAAVQGDGKALASLIKLIGTSVETVSPYSALDAAEIAAFLVRNLPRDGGTLQDRAVKDGLSADEDEAEDDEEERP